MINSLGIDIRINLSGQTKGARNNIFALKPAPIQAVWLGFPSTMGSKYMDYFIGDSITSPIESASNLSEKLALLLDSYFKGDHKRRCLHLMEKIYIAEDAQTSATFNSVIINGEELFKKINHSQSNKTLKKSNEG